MFPDNRIASSSQYRINPGQFNSRSSSYWIVTSINFKYSIMWWVFIVSALNASANLSNCAGGFRARGSCNGFSPHRLIFSTFVITRQTCCIFAILVNATWRLSHAVSSIPATVILVDWRALFSDSRGMSTISAMFRHKTVAGSWNLVSRPEAWADTSASQAISYCCRQMFN